ncbi:unnamed protein product [Paramecium sonneborni]|uniref:Uncharacterized protein n=1 Tax=Paramecium sonneborni TaxID=65129 RepID=A0A8S1QGR8_9CILI|nr:unnamed protein product [Paramecium sonneborni]
MCNAYQIPQILIFLFQAHIHLYQYFLFLWFNIQYLIDINTQIDIYSNDLPQEILQLKQSYIRKIKLQKLMEFKNEVIQKKIKEDIERLVNQEIQKLFNLVDQYQQENQININFNAYFVKLILIIDDQFKFIKCKYFLIVQFEFEEIPQENLIGTQRHFFGRSKVMRQF